MEPCLEALEESYPLLRVEQDQGRAEVLLHRPVHPLDAPEVRQGDVRDPRESLELAVVAGRAAVDVGPQVSFREIALLQGLVEVPPVREDHLLREVAPAIFLGFGLGVHDGGAVTLFERLEVLLPDLRGIDAAADEVGDEQVVVVLAEEGAQGCHLAGRSADQYLLARLDERAHAGVEPLQAALQVLGTPEPGQVALVGGDVMADGEILVEDRPADIPARAVQDLGHCREHTARSAVEDHFQVPVLRCIADRFGQVVLLQFLDVKHRADLLAQAAFDTLAGIDFRVPEPFRVGPESDGILGTDVPAGVAAAAVSLVLYMDHSMSVE